MVQEVDRQGGDVLRAQVWTNNCTRCHSARPSAERADAQWTVIVNHMRARANLTKTQAWLATSFLQATNVLSWIQEYLRELRRKSGTSSN